MTILTKLNIMKRVLTLCIYLSIIYGYSQNLQDKDKQSNGQQFQLALTGGISSPSSNFSKNAFTSNGSYFELLPSYYFSKFGIGATIGYFSNKVRTLSKADAGNALNASFSFPTTNNRDSWNSVYYGVGPEVKFNFGQFEVGLTTRFGEVTIKPIRLELSAVTGGVAGSNIVPLYILETSKNTNTAYFSTGLNFGYSLSNKVTLFFKSSYFSSSKGITVNVGKRTLSDINKDGVIDLKDIEKFTSSTAGFSKSKKIIKPQYFNYGFGLRYVFDGVRGHLTGVRKAHRTGRNPQTGATIKGIAQNDSIPTKLKGECLGYASKSTMIIVKIDQTSLRKTNTKVNKGNTTYINGKRMSIRALRARNGYRAKRVGRVRANDVRARHARAKDARVKDARVKNARVKDARVKNARVKDARVKDIRTSAVAGKDWKRTIHSDKPVKIVTGENNRVKPQTDLSAKYLKIQNNQTIHISKSYLQLIAPYFTCKNSTKTINYSWTVKNKALNKDDSFKGNNIKYNFNVDGTYEIEITPIVNNSSLSPYNIIIICK